MNEYTSGHRERVRARYLRGKNALDDYELLELLLMYSIPRKDVKPLAKDILKHFGTFENVFNATVEQLMRVEGVGESTAILINLHNTIEHKIGLTRNESIKQVSGSRETKVYCKNLFRAMPNERIAVVCFDNSGNIIGSQFMSEGSANKSQISPRKFIDTIVTYNPAAVVVTHNHPHGGSDPSHSDIDFTNNVRSILNTVDVVLLDHIIVGESSEYSMRSSTEYGNLFF